MKAIIDDTMAVQETIGGAESPVVNKANDRVKFLQAVFQRRTGCHGTAGGQNLNSVGNHGFALGLDIRRTLEIERGGGIGASHHNNVRAAFFTGRMDAGLGFEAENIGAGLAHPFHDRIHFTANVKNFRNRKGRELPLLISQNDFLISLGRQQGR